MALITSNTDYAIRALLYMAKNKKRVSVAKMAKKTKIPYPFLRRILQVLHKKGILYAYKGKNGGFAFRIKPNRIYVLDLIKIFQKDIEISKCLFKKRICPDRNSCRLKVVLDSIERYAFLKLKSLSIEELLN